MEWWGRKGSAVSSGWDCRCIRDGEAGLCMTLTVRLQSSETTCPLFSQACVWSSRHPVLSEWCPAPHTALSWRGCLAPLLPHGGRGLGAGLPHPDGHFAYHPNAFQSADPSDPGAKWDFRLAEETAFAQILSRLQTAYNGEGMLAAKQAM